MGDNINEIITLIIIIIAMKKYNLSDKKFALFYFILTKFVREFTSKGVIDTNSEHEIGIIPREMIFLCSLFCPPSAVRYFMSRVNDFGAGGEDQTCQHFRTQATDATNP
jgi:hypothetical protein